MRREKKVMHLPHGPQSSGSQRSKVQYESVKLTDRSEAVNIWPPISHCSCYPKLFGNYFVLNLSHYFVLPELVPIMMCVYVSMSASVVNMMQLCGWWVFVWAKTVM